MGLKVYGGTLTPFQAFLPGIYYTADGEAQRQAVNQWIRTSKAYDAVIDFDKAIRDPRNPATMRPAYDSGDNLHPNDAGYQAMADAIDLSLFRDRFGAPCGRREGRPSPPAASRSGALPVPAVTRPSGAGDRRERDQYGSLALSFRIGASTRCHIAVASRTVRPSRAAKGGSVADHGRMRGSQSSKRPHEEVDEIQAVADLAEEAKGCVVEEPEHPAVVRLPQSQHHRQEARAQAASAWAADA